MVNCLSAPVRPDSVVVEVDDGRLIANAGLLLTATLGERGYRPILATRAGSGEVLHGRLRKGSAASGRGARAFVKEVVARARRSSTTRSPSRSDGRRPCRSQPLARARHEHDGAQLTPAAWSRRDL
jgi:hypothetical protein